MDRRAEVELERLTARRALDLQRLRRAAVAARQRAIVELQHEVAAAAFVRRDRARDVEAAVLVRRREQAARRRETHCRACPASPSSCRPLRFASSKTLPMTSVQSSAGSGTMRTVADASPDSAIARQRAHRLRAVHELAFADAGADGEQQPELCRPSGVTVEAGPRELAARHDAARAARRRGAPSPRRSGSRPGSDRRP